MDDFDPYYIWLGIPPEEQPADYYRLLGVRRFEQNPDVIANAAEGKMAYLRTLQVGKRAKQSQALLNEIAAAQACLLNSKSRAAYDARLRAADAAKNLPPSPVPAPVVPLAPLPAAPTSLPASAMQVPLAPVAVKAVVAASPAFPLNLHSSPRTYPTAEPAGAWERLQYRLESLPRGVVLAIGAGPVVVALLILVAVIIATSGDSRPPPDPALATAAKFPSVSPPVVPPQPIPAPPTPPAPLTGVRPSADDANRPTQPAPSALPGPPAQLRIDAAGAQIHRAVFSYHGEYLALDATDQGKRRVQVFEVQSGRKLMAIDGPELTGRMAMAGDLILIASEPQGITAFEAQSGRLRTLTRIDGGIRDVALSRDGRWAFVLTETELQLLDTEGFKSQGNLLRSAGQHGFERLDVQPNLVMAAGDAGLEVVQVDTRRQVAALRRSSSGAWRAFLPDDQSYFRFWENGGRIDYERQGLNGRGRFAAAQLPPGVPPISEIAGEQGGHLIAWHGPQRELTLFDLIQARPVGRIVPSEGELGSVAISAGGERLAAREGNGPLLVYSVGPLMRGPIGFAWPNPQQLQQAGGMRTAMTSVSISGPATRNVGVGSITKNGPAAPRSSAPTPPPAAPAEASTAASPASPEMIREAIFALQSAGVQLHTQDPARLNHLQLASVDLDPLAEHIAVFPRLSTLIINDDCRLTARFFAGLQGSSVINLHLPAAVDDRWLAEISQLRSVTSVALRREASRGGGFTPAGLEQLAAMPSLNSISLFGDLQIDDIDALAKLRTLKHVTWFANGEKDPRRLMGLTRLPGLHSLTLDAPIDDTFVISLAETCPELQGLSAQNSILTDAGLKALAQLTKLGHFSVGGEFTPEAFRSLDQLQQLQTVQLDRVSLTGSHIQTLAKLPLLANIQLSHSNLDEGAVDEFCKMKQLRNLGLHHTYVSSEGLTKLKAAIKRFRADNVPARPLPKQRATSPEERQVIAELIERLQGMGAGTSLNGQGELDYLHLPRDIPDEDAKKLELLRTVRNFHFAQSVIRPGPTLAALKNMDGLETLAVPYSIDDECLATLAEMDSLTRLTILPAAGGEQSGRRLFTATGLAKLGQLKLQSLTIHGKLDGKDLKALQQCEQLSELYWTTSDSPSNLMLGQFTQFPELRQLSLGCNGNEGTVKTVADALPKLTRLHLHGGLTLTDRSLKHLTSLGDLGNLDVSGDFTAIGSKCFAEMEALEVLTLRQSELTRPAVEQLATSTSLQRLYLHNMKFQPGAVKALAELQGLQQLTIYDSEVSAEDAATLKKANNNFQVYQNGRQL